MRPAIVGVPANALWPWPAVSRYLDPAVAHSAPRHQALLRGHAGDVEAIVERPREVGLRGSAWPRRLCATARRYSDSSTTPPTDSAQSKSASAFSDLPIRSQSQPRCWQVSPYKASVIEECWRSGVTISWPEM